GRHGVRVLPAARQCGYDEAIDVL
ncbi:MAG: hypothetical protein QOI80_2331, partial [Solirubrobacteraceae bacterium]|nr:hypothetical protein [Solirubrobacteraceae bacterium]